MTFKILQLNAQHKKSTNLILQHELSKFDIIFLQEPYVPSKGTKIPAVLKNYTEISSLNGKQKAAILIKNDIPNSPYFDFITEEIAATRLRFTKWK